MFMGLSGMLTGALTQQFARIASDLNPQAVVRRLLPRIQLCTSYVDVKSGL
jgi:hypothetical protein